jgi:hypothetical protein
MPSGQYNFNVSVAGEQSSKNVVREFDHQNAYRIALPAAHALSSWVKTDADTAAGNLTGGHGLTTGTFDIYWDGGQRYDVDCTITTNAVALDGGTGTDFPATSDTTVRMSPQTTINTAIDGDEIQLAFLKLSFADEESAERGLASFYDVGDGPVFDCDTAEGLDANATLVYDVVGGAANPFTGNPITYCIASHSGVGVAATLVIASGEDSTP